MTAGLWIVPGESADRLARVFLASFPSGPWQANCYVAATAAGRDCVIVDPGVGAADGLRRLVSARSSRIVARQHTMMLKILTFMV